MTRKIPILGSLEARMRQKVGHADDGRHRCSDLVARHGQKARFSQVCSIGGIRRLGQIPGSFGDADSSSRRLVSASRCLPPMV